jgi:hypothetical protein
MVIGYCWQSYVDGAAEKGPGRCGLVGRDDAPHEALVAAAADTNAALYELAAVGAEGKATGSAHNK